MLRTSPFWSKEGFSKETYNEQVESTLRFRSRPRSVCQQLQALKVHVW